MNTVFEPAPWNKVACRTYVGPDGKHTYAVCIVRGMANNLCWEGYHMVTNIDGPAVARFWQKVPCRTSSQEKRYPKHLARAGQEFLKEYQEGI